MNYSGKFDATLSPDASGTKPVYFHVDSAHVHAPADAIIVPDAQFLFNADFKRSGADLILSRDGHQLTLRDYFRGEKSVALASPDGSHLTGDIVSALAGGHVQISQAGGGTSAAGTVIGHVTKLQGSATVTRNGASVVLNMGDNVEKGDVVQTSSSSTVGITFIDNSVFSAGPGTRLALDQFRFDSGNFTGEMLADMQKGTLTVVSGDIVRSSPGQMRIRTLSAVLGAEEAPEHVDLGLAHGGAHDLVRLKIARTARGHPGRRHGGAEGRHHATVVGDCSAGHVQAGDGDVRRARTGRAHGCPSCAAMRTCGRW